MIRIFIVVTFFIFGQLSANDVLQDLGNQFRIEVVKLSQGDEGFNVEDKVLNQALVERLSAEGLKITENKDAPKLVLQVVSLPLMMNGGGKPVGFAYSLTLKLQEWESLTRTKKYWTLVSTWDYHVMQITKDKMYTRSLWGSIDGAISQFIIEYREAN